MKNSIQRIAVQSKFRTELGKKVHANSCHDLQSIMIERHANNNSNEDSKPNFNKITLNMIWMAIGIWIKYVFSCIFFLSKAKKCEINKHERKDEKNRIGFQHCGIYNFLPGFSPFRFTFLWKKLFFPRFCGPFNNFKFPLFVGSRIFV